MHTKRFLCFYLFLVSALCVQLGYGQTLTISDSGQTGTSGTNWSISGNTLTATDNASVHPRVIEKALDSGDLSVQVTGEKGTIHIQSPIHSFKSRILKLIAQSSIQVYEPIEISGGEIYLSVRDNQTALGSICVDGQISVASTMGQGGNILLEANDISLSEKAVLTATGPTGGGNILVGGDWQGGASAENRVFEDPNKLKQATKVSMHSKAIIDASATENGNGGTVVLWSDIKNPASVTKAHGTIFAKGGSRSGDGGMIETSGSLLETDGIQISTLASLGNDGLWLLDPYNYFLGVDELNTLNTALNSSNVNILTSNSSNSGIDSVFDNSNGGGHQIGSGHIVFTNDFTYTGSNNRTLTLTADADIYLKNISSTNAALTLNVNASGDQVFLDDDINTNGGSVNFNSGDVHLQKSGDQSIVTSNGNLNFNNSNIELLKSGGAVIYNSGTGNLNLGTGLISYTDTKKSISSPSQLMGWSGRKDGRNDDTDIDTGVDIETGKEYSMRLFFWDSWDSEVFRIQVGSFSSSGSLYFRASRSYSSGITVSHANYGLQYNIVDENEDLGVGSYNDAYVDITFVAERSGNLIMRHSLNQNDPDESAEINDVYETTFSTDASFSSTRSLKLQTTDGQISGAGNINDVTSLELETNSANNTLSGIISGSANLIKSGTGTFTLTQNNTFSGSTTISNGTLVLENDAPNPSSKTISGTGKLIIQPSSSSFSSSFSTSDWTFNPALTGITIGKTSNASDVTIGSDLSANGPISIFGGDITLNAHLTTSHLTSGDIEINGSKLLGSSNITVASGRELEISQLGNSIYSGIISGTNSTFVKSGTGSLMLSGSNTYSGATTVSQGNLILGHSNAIPAASEITVNGLLNLNGFDLSVSSLSGSGEIVNYGGYDLFSGDKSLLNGLILYLDAGNPLSYSGSGTNWEDLSPAGSNVSLVGTPVFSNTDGSFNFTKNNYAQVNEGKSNFYDLTSGFSVFSITNFGTVNNNWERIIDFGNGENLDNVFFSRNYNSNTLDFQVRRVSEASGTSLQNGIINDSWASYAATVNNNDESVIYRDGFALTTSSTGIKTPTNATRDKLYIGQSNWSSDDQDIDMGLLLIYNRALSSSEISAIHSATETRTDATFTVNTATNSTFNGTFKENIAKLNLVKSGTGTLTLSSNSTNSGSTTISGGTLILENNAPNPTSKTITGTGKFIIQPSSSSFSSVFSTSGWTFNSALSGITIGKNSNTSGITIGSDLSANGPISIYGEDITVNANLSSTLSSADILLKAAGNIDQAASTSLTTNGGDITYWSDSDSDGGYINIAKSVTFDTRTDADRTANDGTSNDAGGGAITLGGGNTSTTLGSGTVVPTGYALKSTADQVGGIEFGTPGTGNAGISLLSGGGDIVLRGKSTTPDNDGESNGILFNSGITIDGGSTGDITLDGQGQNGTYNAGVYTSYQLLAGDTLLRTENGDISITGESLGGGGSGNRGILLQTNSGNSLTVEATGTGSVSIMGDAGSSGNGLLDVYSNNTVHVLAASGSIIVEGQGSGNFYTTDAMTIGHKTGTNVTASNSNIEIRDDELAWGASGSLQFNTTGIISIEPYGDDFSSALSTEKTAFHTGVTGLTIGKNASSSDGTGDAAVILSNTISITGPISVYGSNIEVNQNLTSTASDANILLKSSGKIILADSKAIQANNGDVTFWADSDASESGSITLNSSTSISSSGGDIILGGGSDPLVGFAYANVTHGVELKSSSVLNSDGGNISIRGQSNLDFNGVSSGIFSENSTINSSAGAISIYGKTSSLNTDTNAQAITLGSISISSSSPNAEAIKIIGDASGSDTRVTSLGVNIYDSSIIQETGTGGIYISGSANEGDSYESGITLQNTTAILAQSGPIIIESNNATRTATINYDLYLSGSSVLGSKAGTDVESSTSNITIRANDLDVGTPTISTKGSLTIEPFGNSFTNDLAWPVSGLNISNNINGLTLGKSSNATNINVNSNQIVAGPISIYGGNITLSNSLTASGTLLLQGSGVTSQSAAVSATTLSLQGSGTFTLNDSENHVENITVGTATQTTGNISFTNKDALTIGEGSKGILSSGTIQIGTLSGNLTISETISTTNNTSSAIKLYADQGEAAGSEGQGNIIISGTPSLTAGSGGRASLYSGKPASSTGLLNLVDASNVRTGVDSATSSFTPDLSAGVYALFRTGPEITFTQSFNSFAFTAGLASQAQSMVISATGLTADVLLTPPTGFELSTDGSSFSDSLNLDGSSGSLANTTVFVRVKSTASDYPSGTMSVTTTGGTPKGIAVQAAAKAALHFDGVNDYVDTGSRIFGSSVTNFSIAFWIYPQIEDSNYHGMIGYHESVLKRNPSIWWKEGKLYYDLDGDGYLSDVVLAPKNHWTYVVWTKQGTQANIYINGVLHNDTPINIENTVYTYANYKIGAVDNNFEGKIDEVSFWNRALSQTEIESQMFETLEGNESGLLAYYNFNDGVPGQSNSGNTTLSDLAGNADGTLTNFSLGSGTTSTWVAHPFPEASLESGYTKMPVALWKEIGINETRSSNGLTMSVGTALTEANYANFASNSNTGTTTTEVPLTDKTRSQRIWYVNETGVVTATVKIGVASATGQAASDYKNPSFSLLYRAGTSGTFSQTQTGTLSGDVLTFTSEPLQDGYYALGIVEQITLTPTSTQSKTYGELDPTFTYSTNPSVTLSGVLTRTTGENVDTYSLSIGTISSTQYSITFVNEDFEITTKTVTVTATDTAKKNREADPTLTYTSNPTVNTSLPNSSTITFTGTITRTAGEAVGTYSITQGTLTNTNYNIVFVPGTFTISPTVPDINGFTDLTLTYGDANVVQSYTSSSTGTPTYTSSNTNVATINSSTGSITTVGVGTTTIWLSLADDGTYEPGTASMTLTVAALPMTVTANAQTKVYGASDPEFTYSYTPSGPLTNTHTVSFTGTLTRTANENAGTYSITQGTLTNTNYNITYVGADFTITSKTLTITAADKTKVYDSAVYTPTDYTVTYDGFENSETDSVLSGTLTYTGTALAATNSGTYVITPGGLTSSNYSITYVSGELSITQKPITIAITDQTKVFGDSDPSPLNAHSVSVGSVYGQTPTGVLTRTAGEDVGTYTIGKGDLTYGSNYIETFVNGNLTITARTITVTAAAKTKVYGISDPELTYTSTPDVGAAVTSGSSQTVTFTGAISRDAGENAGTYSITLGTLTNTNYTIDYVGADFTITKAPTTIEDGDSDPATDTLSDTIIYFGDSDILLTATSSNTANYTFTSSDSSVASITTTNTNTAFIRNLKVGSAIITIAQGADANYQAKTVSYTLRVDPLGVTVTPASTQSKTYGEPDTTIEYTTSPNGALSNSSTVTFTGTLSRTAGTDAGTYSITIGTLTNTNYALTLTEVDYTINKRPITISAEAKTKVYGATDPNLTHTISSGSIVSGDSETGVLTRTAGETAGTYTITQNTLTYGDNYDETYEAEYLTITNATVTLTVSDYTKVYDKQFIESSNLSFTATGLVNGDTIADLGTPEYTVSGTATNTVGTYSITLSGLSHDSYNIVYVGGNASITPATLTITANTLSKTYGDIDPNLTHTTIGLISGDTFTGTLTRTVGEDVGTYTISNDNLTYGNNYTENFVSGTLTITTKAVSVTADAQTKNFGDVDPELTYSVSPSINTTLANNSSTITFTGSLTRTLGENAGTYSITIGTLTNTNYSISYTSNDLTIHKIAPTLTFSDISLVYGDSDLNLIPSSSLSYSLISPSVNDGNITWSTSGAYRWPYGEEDYSSAEFGGIYFRPWLDSDYSWTAVNTNDKNGYLQINLNEVLWVEGIITQGRAVRDQWITRAKVEYSVNNIDWIVAYPSVNLNSDRNTKVTTDFEKPVQAKYIRIKPLEFNNHASVRMGVKVIEGGVSLLQNNPSVGTISGTSFINENVGSTVITYTQDSSTNYLSATTSFTLTVNPLDIALTPTDGLSKVYGDTDPSLTYTTVPSGSLSNSATVTFTGTLTRTTGEDVGTYSIGIGTLTNTNYNITYTSKDFEITSRTITVTAAAKSKVYGDSEPILTYTSTPAIGDPVVTGSSKTVSFTGTITRTAGEEAGTYSITLGTLTNTNYTIDYVGADFTITKAPTAIEDGDSDPATETLSDTIITFGDSDILLTPTSSNTADYTFTSSDSSVASITTTSTNTAAIRNLKVGSAIITISQGEDANYQAKTVSYTLTVNPLPVTVTPTATQSKTYGEADLTLTYTTTPALSSSLNNSSTVTFTGSLSRTLGENAGTYSITIGTLTNTNYALSFTETDYTIGRRPITISAEAKTKVYGATDPSLTYTITAGSIVSGDSASGVLTRTSGEAAGTYTITQNTLTYGNNYDETYQKEYLTITNATVTLTVLDYTKVYDKQFIESSNLSFTATGLVNGDTIDSLVGTPVYTVSGTATNTMGTYSITLSGLSHPSYNIEYVGANATITPATLTITAGTLSKTYGDADPELTHTTIGLISGDTPTGTLTRTVGEDVGTYTISNDNLTYGNNYTENFVSGTLTITTKAVTVTANAQTKVHGDIDPELTYSLSPAINTTLANNTSTITFTGSLSRTLGEDVGTYAIGIGTLTNTNFDITFTPADLTITKLPVVITPTASQSKTYGEVDPTLTYTTLPILNSTLTNTTSTVTFTGSLSRTTGENVNDYTINIGTLTNTNYDITLNPETFEITKKTITVSGITAGDKVYDGTTTSTLDLSSITFTGKEAVDTITATVTGTFDSKNIGTGKTVTLSASYSSTALDNYTIVDQTSTTASITARTITATLIGAVDKIYNATTSATLTASNYQLGGFVGGESATITQTFGTYDTKDIGSSKEVSVSLTDAYLPASGTLLSNYSLAATATGTVGNITAKTLTVTNITVLDKVYDGSTTSSVNSSTIVYNGLELGDDVSINSTSGVFDNKNVGIGKTVTLTNTYTGADLNNYTLVDQATATASITAKTVSVSLIGSVTKIYNGTISASLNPSNFQVSGVISGESIGISATQGTYDTKEIGTSKMVTVALTDYYLPDSGTLLSNYALAATATGTVGTITAQTLTVTGIVVLDKVYDGTVSSTVMTSTIDYEGLAPGDNVYINTSSGLFTDANVGLGKTVNLTNTYAGTDLANYTLVNQATTTASITAKPITIIPTTAQSKTYGLADATLSYTISPSTLPDGTAISLGGTLSRTTGEHVGTYSITIGTVSDTNYNITLSPETFAINKKTITVSGITAGDKVYDGTTTSTLDLSSITFTGKEAVDTITATVTGTFDSKNIGTGKTVTLTASYSSTALDNYTIVDQTSTTASITAKPVYVSGDTGIDKTFDNTTNLPLGEIGYGALTGVLTGEDVALSGVGVYDAATAGLRTIAIGTVTLTGVDKDNYALNWTNGSGTIAKKTLTVTANNDAKFVTEPDTSGYNGVSYTGFEGDDSISDINISGLSISRSNSSTNTAAGTYVGTLVPSGVTATNYDISYVNGDYTIIPADKLLLKVSNQTTTYGTAATYSITSAQYYKTGTGLVNLSVPTPSAGVYPINDGASTINIEIVPDSPVNSSAGKLTVGSYDLTANVVSGSSGNFSNNIEVIGNHSVAKQSLTASASSVSKEYDATTAMAGVRLSLATLETGDVVTVNGTGAFSSPNVGTGLGYTISGLNLSGTDANNYYLSAGASFSGSNGVITKAPLSITANNDNGVDTDPAYSGGNGVIYSGFKGTDSETDLSGTLTYTGSSQGATAAGTYAIEPTGITSSNYSITFVAGELTIIVGDSDGDGVRDPSDNCPTTPNADQADTDGDGVGDVCDNAPNTPNADQADTDGDGTPDAEDNDDDNDGVPDNEDDFPTDPNETTDSDGDGQGDNADNDIDNDGVLNSVDNCIYTPNTDQLDTDLDGIGNACDNDDDGDGYSDADEIACGSDPLLTSSKPLDTDADGIPNCLDEDDDNDGYSDLDELGCDCACEETAKSDYSYENSDPLDATSVPADEDKDGIPDCFDEDKDNDGYLDASDAFPLDPSEWLDSDADGIGNNADEDDDNDGQSDIDEMACGSDPLDNASLSPDFDQDNIPDCVDTDDDNDGVKDTEDAFPLDPAEWMDTDLDDIGNNADEDDDNDGYSDLDELACNSNPLDVNSVPEDLDGDGIPDCLDNDIDGDGCINTQDVFPRDPSECEDTDGDGLGNNVDVDDDNDGVIDQDDAFPLDPSESIDADADGIGDNADTDIGNDGFDDEKILASGVLTPNSSGMENTWKVINIDQYPQARVSVYDKNGLEVFSAQNYRNDWRGTYKNSPNLLPAASYYYVIQLNTGEEPITGWMYITY